MIIYFCFLITDVIFLNLHVKGDAGMKGTLATRVSGSADLYRVSIIDVISSDVFNWDWILVKVFWNFKFFLSIYTKLMLSFF